MLAITRERWTTDWKGEYYRLDNYSTFEELFAINECDATTGDSDTFRIFILCFPI